MSHMGRRMRESILFNSVEGSEAGASCQLGLERVLIDVWSSSDTGAANAARLRGHQLTDL